MSHIILVCLAVVGLAAGVSAVMQQVLVSEMRSATGSALWAVLISYVGGTIAAALIIAGTREPILTSAEINKIPLASWSAGVFGVIYITLAIFLIPRLGAATVLALLISGQMLASIAFDHFGLFGLSRQPIGGTRLLGAALLLGGVMLIRR